MVLLFAGCGQNPDLSVSLYQTRTDTPVDKIEIQVQNNESDAVTVQRAKLVSSGLSASPVWEQLVDIPAGAAIDLKVQLPQAVCSGEAVTEVELTVDDRSFTIPAHDRLGQLAKYRQAQCFRQEVERAGSFTITGLDGDRLIFETDLDIGAIRSTTLFIPEDQTNTSVRLTPNRCDAHALAEDKQGTYFPVPVRVGDRSADYSAAVSAQIRGQLYDLYAKLCEL
jgi:hypothetical protein